MQSNGNYNSLEIYLIWLSSGDSVTTKLAIDWLQQM